MTDTFLGDREPDDELTNMTAKQEHQVEEQYRMEEEARVEEQADIEPPHSEECALNCEHCHHGSDCFKTCCQCGGVRDGEGTVSMEFVECDCEPAEV